jgi:hypothetical protein
MAGVSITTRRFVEPTAPLPRMHYEAVVETVHGAVIPGRQLDVETRIRLGEVAHLGAGAFWGVVFALMTRGRSVGNPVTQGTMWGSVVWVIAFAGYMPGFKISKALWQMSPYELFRTWISHTVYATATFLALKSASE